MRERATDYLRNLQDHICAGLEALDGVGRFREDAWDRPGGGGGRTRVLTGGALFEKAGVNFSEVFGELTEDFSKQLPGDGRSFTAAGVSLVLHPLSPLVPTVHANFRYLTHGAKSWFGGGADLTPFYPVREDVIHFHRTWKDVCDRHSGVASYATMKAECDRYFYLPHRGEARGVGGIFFDYMSDDLETAFAFVRDAGNAFLPAYVPIAERRKGLTWTEGQRSFQQYRRGRYVEFNLLYDRGTVFGLKTNGRTESILMSLPPTVRWEYDYRPEPGSPEAELTEVYLKPQDWLANP
ncbi:MAG: oxygen-dependent coproporphyrinogen oxidase [Gemmataceae bacterium]